MRGQWGRNSEGGRKRAAGRKKDGPVEENERKQGIKQTGQRRKIVQKSIIEHGGTVLQHLLIPITADIHKQYLASFIFHTKG